MITGLSPGRDGVGTELILNILIWSPPDWIDPGSNGFDPRFVWIDTGFVWIDPEFEWIDPRFVRIDPGYSLDQCFEH